MIRVIIAVLLAGIVGLIGLVVWGDAEIDAFEVRCLEAGGADIKHYGTSMSSWVCLTEDGRIVDVEGPGL